jgi:acyl carrier protein
MESRIKAVMAAVFEVPVDEITDESSSVNIESWDSLKHMNLALALEEEFDVNFSDEELVKMLSVETIVETLKKKALSQDG